MKKILLAVSFIVIMMTSHAQHTRLNGYAAYVFDDSFSSYYDNNNYYDGKIKGGFLWGLGLEFTPRVDYGVEISYLNHSTKAPISYQEGVGTPVKRTDFDLTLNYAMIGGNRLMMTSGGKVEGYGGLSAGAVFVNVKNPENGNSDNATKFAWGAKLGVNIWVNPKIGIKLQTQLLSAVQGAGGGLYFGTGGVGAGVSTYSTMYQFVLGGGLTFKLGQ